VADCPGDEGGGKTFYYDPSSGALLAIARYPSLISAGLPGCFVGRDSVRPLYEAGMAPSCAQGPLLGCGVGGMQSSFAPTPDGATDGSAVDAFE
jgi:hypothetical protein